MPANRTAKAFADAPARKLPPAITFICTGCEAVEHRRTPALPEGWTTQDVGDDVHAFCAECSEDAAAPRNTWQ